MTRPDTGFSLVEALVALLVLSIATAGLMRAVQGHADTVRGLQDRAVAFWIAENRLAEASLPGVAAPPDGEASMLGRRFRAETTTRPTEDPDLAQITVSVRREGETTPLAVLEGFVDRGAPPPAPTEAVFAAPAAP